MFSVQIRVCYFASLREALGPGGLITVPAHCSVAQVRDFLCAASVLHAQVLGRDRPVRCALNQVLCDEAAAVSEGVELAFFPPVTGG